ncbi:hypothetical protein CGMCC3_g631 [Colletotrichum fructicola]|nr:uncharacterized protein CGMCC3_g631 [Colletotrichum fructicola]KAE9583902.1 hypothetical protein CGMCC3_g631 [Colletotrichum fructicola]
MPFTASLARGGWLVFVRPQGTVASVTSLPWEPVGYLPYGVGTWVVVVAGEADGRPLVKIHRPRYGSAAAAAKTNHQ